MIRSMTAFGSAKAETEQGTLNIEIRSVNSRFLDLNFRLPDDLRMVEAPLRDMLSREIARGKVDIRANYARKLAPESASLDTEALKRIAGLLATAREIIPDVPAPRLNELLSGANGNEALDPETWTAMATEACARALTDLRATREREGQRLAGIMSECAQGMNRIVQEVEASLPVILEEHQQKLAQRLKDALLTASPDGFALISGEELSARIAQETSLFSLRIDVAEELARLRSHIAELEHILGKTHSETGKQAAPGRKAGSAGKRLDFLFQEMNREANTLGSKAGALSMTRSAIDLKLLIEQMREQAQNIE